MAKMVDRAAEYGLAGYLHAGDVAGRAEPDVFGIDDLGTAALAVESQAFPPVQRGLVFHRPMRQAIDIGHVLIIGGES